MLKFASVAPPSPRCDRSRYTGREGVAHQLGRVRILADARLGLDRHGAVVEAPAG
jgi:hypothetical protein